MTQDPFHYFKTSREEIQLVVMMDVRFPLSLRNVEDFLHERGVDVCHENIRMWVDRFSPIFAKKIRSKHSTHLRHTRNGGGHLDEVFVKINGIQHYLWRAVDHEDEVLECYVPKKRDKLAALRFLKKARSDIVSREWSTQTGSDSMEPQCAISATRIFRTQSNTSTP